MKATLVESNTVVDSNRFHALSYLFLLHTKFSLWSCPLSSRCKVPKHCILSHIYASRLFILTNLAMQHHWNLRSSNSNSKIFIILHSFHRYLSHKISADSRITSPAGQFLNSSFPVKFFFSKLLFQHLKKIYCHCDISLSKQLYHQLGDSRYLICKFHMLGQIIYVHKFIAHRLRLVNGS